jgi:hypothetical protein
VPYNKYRVIAGNDSTLPISKKLQAVRDKVLAGNFVDDTGTPRISFSNIRSAKQDDNYGASNIVLP